VKNNIFWVAKTKDGNYYNSMEDLLWKDIENDIIELSLHYGNGQKITLPSNKEKYIQATTCSADLTGGNCSVESKYIGFIEGNKKFIIRVNAKTYNITVEQ
jgi:hypothetical protein